MPVTVDSVDTLRRYFRGVVDRANHHGRNVNEIVYPLMGLVLYHMDDDADIQVRGTEGSVGNVLWFPIQGNRYAIVYNHIADKIELRARSIQGVAVGGYDNHTAISVMMRDFDSLPQR